MFTLREPQGEPNERGNHCGISVHAEPLKHGKLFFNSLSRTVILGFVIGSQSEFNSCEPMRHFPPPLAYGQANPWIFQVRCTQNISCQMSSISVFMCGQRSFATNELLCDSQSDQNQISRRRLKCFISIRRIIWMVASDSEFWDIIDNCDWASIIRVK